MDEARDVPSSGDQMFRLRAGDIHFSGGKIRDCLRPSGGVYPRCNYDEYDAARDAREHYDATGVFSAPIRRTWQSVSSSAWTSRNATSLGPRSTAW
jgi:hypothetical protein